MQKANSISQKKEPRRAKSKAIVSPAGKIAASRPLTKSARPMRTMAKPPTSATGLSGMRWMKNTWKMTTTTSVGARSRAASCRSWRTTRSREPRPMRQLAGTAQQRQPGSPPAGVRWRLLGCAAKMREVAIPMTASCPEKEPADKPRTIMEQKKSCPNPCAGRRPATSRATPALTAGNPVSGKRETGGMTPALWKTGNSGNIHGYTRSTRTLVTERASASVTV